MECKNTSVDKFNGISISVNTLNPQSTGSIRIKSNDYRHDPIIFPNYLSDADGIDIKKHLDGIKKIRNIVNTDPINKLIVEEKVPGKKFKSDVELREFIKNFSTTIYHATGTCRFGSENNGVTDENFRVYGVRNLRVCDASVMPESINGNTAATCYVLGKILASLI